MWNPSFDIPIGSIQKFARVANNGVDDTFWKNDWTEWSTNFTLGATPAEWWSKVGLKKIVQFLTFWISTEERELTWSAVWTTTFGRLVSRYRRLASSTSDVIALISRVYILVIVYWKSGRNHRRSRSSRQVYSSWGLTAKLGNGKTLASFDFYPISLPSKKLWRVVCRNIFSYTVRNLGLDTVIWSDTPFPQRRRRCHPKLARSFPDVFLRLQLKIRGKPCLKMMRTTYNKKNNPLISRVAFSELGSYRVFYQINMIDQ